MKTIIKYILVIAVVFTAFVSCDKQNETEANFLQKPTIKDDAYYFNLKEYKKTKHEIAFGWYGGWTGDGACMISRMSACPDSMDIIALWGEDNWYGLTPTQMKDKEYVQNVLGTKVVFTIFAHEVPAPFTSDSAGVAAYAKAYAYDSINKYGLDGIDLDYEPGFGGSGPLCGHDVPLMSHYVNELSKYVGPASGTGKLLIIDGVPFALFTKDAKLFDYGVVQAYSSSGYSDLQSRFNSAFNKGWKPEQYVFAENFEDHWRNGGVSHQLRNGKRVQSLEGMARFQPTQGVKGGTGAYHFEYEYGHADQEYKFMRRAIQIQNPAVK